MEWDQYPSPWYAERYSLQVEAALGDRALSDRLYRHLQQYGAQLAGSLQS